MDRLNIEQRSRNMKAVKSSGSKIERKLALALWHKGYRYRKNDKTVDGKPDLVFKKFKIAIFVDGEFWHGKDWETKKHQHKSNTQFWHNKIEKNIERDKIVNTLLTDKGWTVLRFWGKDINQNLVKCVEKIEKAISINQ